MKKLLIVFLSFIILQLSYGANLYLKGGLTTMGKYKIETDLGFGKTSAKEDVKTSLTGALDLTIGLANVEVGVGFGAEASAELKDYDMETDITFIPLYLVGKVNLLGPYAIGKLGYSVPIPKGDFKNYVDESGLDIEGGSYFGIGVGYEIAIVVVEGMYSVSKGKIGKDDFEYSKFCLMAGVKF